MPTLTFDDSDPITVSPTGARIIAAVREADASGGLDMSMTHPAARMRLFTQGLVELNKRERIVLTPLGWRVAYALADSTTEGTR